MSDYDPHYIPNYALFVLSVKVLIFNQNGDLLILRRSDKTSHPHGWDFAGGGVDKDEAPDDAARREALEETGITIDAVHIISTHHGYHKDKEYVMLGYVAHAANDAVALSWEHEAYEWMSVEAVLQLELLPQYRAIVEAYQVAPQPHDKYND